MLLRHAGAPILFTVLGLRSIHYRDWLMVLLLRRMRMMMMVVVGVLLQLGSKASIQPGLWLEDK